MWSPWGIHEHLGARLDIPKYQIYFRPRNKADLMEKVKVGTEAATHETIDPQRVVLLKR